MANTLAWVGTTLFAIIFIMSGIGHLTKADAMAGYAAHKGVPSAKLAVQISGIVILVGGLSVLTHISMQLGSLLLAGFCLAAAFQMHAFWKETDPMAKINEQTAFLKDLALAGGALAIYAAATIGGVF
jgi:putative oxidoreductase